MRVLFLVSMILIIPSMLLATPIIQKFVPKPGLEVPARVAGSDQKSLKKYEIELAYRLEQKPDDPYLSHKLGTILFHQGRVSEAKSAWNRASRKDSNLASAELMLDIEEIFSLITQKEDKLVQEKLYIASQKYKNNPHFFLIQAEQFMGSKLFDQAEKSYLHALDLNPGLYITNLNIGRFYEFKQNQEKARKYYLKACKLGPEISECWMHLGRHQFREGNPQQALISFKKVKKLNGQQPSAEIQLAKLSYSIRDYIGARFWYKKALSENPDNPKPIRVALSDVQFRLGLLDEAFIEIETVLKTDEIVHLLVAKATIYESQNKPEEAYKTYQRALELSPENIIANNNIAMLMIRENISSENALHYAEKAYKTKPNNPKIFSTYACALYSANNIKKAKKMLTQAVRISPGDAWVRFFYGKLLFKEKKLQQSILHLEGTMIIDPEFPNIDEIQKLLKKAK
jgi:tetratricopeptide (TPR) repeat protein